MTTNNFPSLGLAEPLLRALEQAGYEHPTPIQAQSIPGVLDGNDLLGIAQTGTGKTAAFALPLLQRLMEQKKPAQPTRPRALILAPTRELASQISQEFTAFGRHTRLRHTVIFGGVGARPQINAMRKGIDIVVATPGRLLDLASERHVDLSAVSILVLDEADRLLDMGFIRDVRKIVAQTPASRQSLLFSATMPQEITSLSQQILKSPVRVDVSPKQVTVKKIEQQVVMVGNEGKRQVLEALLRKDAVSRAIVFTRTKHGANKVAKQLVQAGISAEAIHGNKSQNARTRALQSFKDGEAWVLVATDIAARGIDIDGVSHVVNYELPHEPESYVHRIGRTGRAGATGVAWSLVAPDEQKRLRAVEKLIRFSPAQMRVEVDGVAHAERPQPSASNASSSAGGQNRQRGTGAWQKSSGSSTSNERRRSRRRGRSRAA